MSKLAIVLFAVLFALIANVDSIFSGDEQSDQLTAKKIIDTVTERFKQKLKDMKKKVRKEVREIIRRSDTFVERSLVEIAEAKNNISIEISHVAEGANISKCIELFEDLDHTANTVVSNMSICVNSTLNIKLEQIKMINHVSKLVLFKLTQFRKDVHQCGNSVNNNQESDKSVISCVDEVARKATDISITNVINLTNKIIKLDESLRLHTILIDCSEMSEYETLYEKLAELKYCNSR